VSSDGPRPAALFWDLDGTLADTHPLIHRCVDETFQEFFGRGYEQHLWERSVGHPLTVVLQQGFDEYGITCDDTDPVILFYRERLKSYEGEVRAFPGAVETVRRLTKERYRQAIVTTKFGEAAARHLETLGLADCFEVVVTGDSCARYKPDPEPFCRALQALDLPPTRCMMIGDSAADVVGARAAGIRTVAALWGTLDLDAVYAARPDFMARRPEDILTLLRIGR
jgi:pyrophosphatase PpaX